MIKKPLRSKTTTVTIQKTGKNTSKKIRDQNQKSARMRRQRGYQWEDTLVKRFNGVNGWKAFRLGSPSIGLPDVLAVSTRAKTIYAIEAKSGTSTSLFVPADQIQRCLSWVKTFDIYKKGQVVLAFKFLSKKRIDIGVYESRELREFFKIWDASLQVTDCVCNYDGKFFAKAGKNTNNDDSSSSSNSRGKTEIRLKNCVMPFKRKKQKTA